MHFLLIAPLAAVAVEVTRKPSMRRGRSFALDPLNDIMRRCVVDLKESKKEFIGGFGVRERKEDML